MDGRAGIPEETMGVWDWGNIGPPELNPPMPLCIDVGPDITGPPLTCGALMLVGPPISMEFAP